ncbi:TIR domain-containing protein [Streptomyces sp. MUSC 125]|uniref:TIR domain-containing protein n=1 Tax=Streptomyces sp. MUSC 125 TaxID=1428624 RepID=UPI00099CB086|nr:TIR domain-containing protein [Streptomyces sp. MUSC 125]
MARKVFYSFRYKYDNWRVQTIKNIGAVEGQPLLSSNAWEDVARQGDAAIKRWIDEQMRGKSCNVVLIGAHTYNRPWIEYEFKKAWSDRKGVLGIHIHKLLDSDKKPTTKGKNPFSRFTLNDGKVQFDQVVPVYDPAGNTSTAAFAVIRDNIESWVEEAIKVRSQW